MTRTFKTNLHCDNCVGKVRPAFDREPGVSRWSVDLASPEHTLTVEGDNVSPARVREIVQAAGFEADEVALPEEKTSYYPLALLIAYLLGIVALIEFAIGSFDATRAMANFMAGFFLAFSFFKLLDVQAFADSYAMYDLLARRSRVYALAYPFIELTLGIAYLVRLAPMATNIITLIVMLIGTAGVLESLLNRRRVKCACLGAVFNLPMSYVTLLEDVSMAAMAILMLMQMQ